MRLGVDERADFRGERVALRTFLLIPPEHPQANPQETVKEKNTVKQ